MHPPQPSSDLDLYSRTAAEAASRVIREYSTSFQLATRLLPGQQRADIRSVYALVRVADEIVDGTAEEAGLGPGPRRDVLDALEQETLTALGSGFSANLIVHAFATTARRTGIEIPLITAFFTSMRRDLDPVTSLSEEQYRSYVHGSAEAVGLMCLRVFLQEQYTTQEDLAELENGARRLGAAFQKINFLRDIAEDAEHLGRCYFPGASRGELSEQRKTEIVTDIDADLHAAWKVIPQLPLPARRPTALAAALFSELNDRLRRTPAQQLLEQRVSVPSWVKIRLLASTVLTVRSGAAR